MYAILMLVVAANPPIPDYAPPIPDYAPPAVKAACRCTDCTCCCGDCGDPDCPSTRGLSWQVSRDGSFAGLMRGDKQVGCYVFAGERFACLKDGKWVDCKPPIKPPTRPERQQQSYYAPSPAFGGNCSSGG